MSKVTTASPFTQKPPWPPRLNAPLAPTHIHTPNLPLSTPTLGLYSRSPILAKCNLLTQEILLRGLGVMKTTMKLMGRPDLQGESRA